MGNFEKLSVLVIVIIIVMILVVAISALTSDPEETGLAVENGGATNAFANNNAGDDRDDWDKSSVSKLDFPDPNYDDKLDSGDPLDVGLDEEPVVGDDNTVVIDSGGDALTSGEEPDSSGGDAPGVAWEYQVQRGETLGAIASRELGKYMRYKEIIELNPGLRPEAIRVGQSLVMPPKSGHGTVTPGGGALIKSVGGAPAQPGSEYVIQNGDDLMRIAKRAYNNFEKWPEIWAANLNVIKDPHDLPVGTRIHLPR